MINFALGEWVMFGSRLAAMGLPGAGLGLAGALAFAGAAMVALRAGLQSRGAAAARRAAR